MGVPIIDGQYCSYAEIEIKLAIFGGLTFVTRDFAALDWEDSLEGEDVYGAGPDVQGTTTGIYKASASMTMYEAKAREFISALAALKQGRAGLAIFDVITHYTPLDGLGNVLTTKLQGCRIKGRATSNAAGSASPTQKVIPLQVKKIIEDGARLV